MLENNAIVYKIIELDKEIKLKKKLQDDLKAMLQAEGLSQLENKNIKYIQYFSEDGSVDLSYKQKLEIENIVLLKQIFGENLDNKITKKEDIKYDIQSKFKNALIALYIGDYKKHNIVQILEKLGLDDKNIKLALKKLKGEYIADKKLLESLGAKDNDGLEEELDAIRENKNHEMLEKYIDINSIDDEFINKVKRAITVDDTLAIGLSYEK